MPLSAKQKSLYWRTWSKVRKTYVELGDYSPSEADQQRHELHRSALGSDKSSAQMDNRDLDAVLDAFQSVLVLSEGPQTGPTRASEQPRKRLIHAILSLGLDDPYIAKITADEFRSTDWKSLDESQLTRLRFTLTTRARRRARAS
ncbi:MAG: hypothetical protein NWR51_14725 [Akkermansiaceae bacterium]|nr:hypothetical protein [Akkermansiaceae bacterium]